MKIHSLSRFARLLLLPVLVALFSLALTASLLVAAPAPPSLGHLGQALALRASLHPLVSSAARTKAFQNLGVPQDLHRASDGRYIYTKPSLTRLHSGAILRSNAATATTAQVNEAVQTFDVFNPPPAFSLAAGQSLTPTNLTPVWTADETMLVFSSNRTTSGAVGTRFHIWAIPVNGGTPVQLTTSTAAAGESATLPHGEFFPALSAGNNQELAFTSDANTANVQNLYVTTFSATTYTVNGKISPTYQGLTASGAPVTGIMGVQRPAFSPSNADEIIFSGLSATGTYNGHRHIYYLYQSTGGYNQSSISLPGKLTDGPADDTDPSFALDSSYIAFASTATQLTANNVSPSSDPNSAPLETSIASGTTAGSNRSIFLMTGQYGLANSGRPVTLPGTDNFGPAWSTTATNPYLNPAPGYEYIAFARGASQAAAHDIFYLQVLQNTQAGGQSSRSNEASSTPLNPLSPVFQVNAGDTGTGFFGGGYVLDNFGTFQVNGGTADKPAAPPVVFNTTGDPGTPPQIYQTDRSGTFTYTFPNLTPNARYRVRLHLADPKDTAPGARIFNVTVNGRTNEPNIDIVGRAQQSPGQLDGLVTDASTGQPLPGATVTLQPNGAVLTTTANTMTDPNTTNPGGPINYIGGIPQGTYTAVVTAPGYGSVSKVVSINSLVYTRADFALSPGTASFSGTVTSNNFGVPGTAISVIDASTGNPATGSTVVTTPAAPTAASGSGAYGPVTLAPGSYYVTATPPAGSGFTTQTQQVTITAAGPNTVNFVLQNTTNTAVGSLGGLVSSSITPTAPLANALVTVLDGTGAVVAVITTSGTTTTPAAPNGDGKPVNYFANLPTGTYTLQFSEAGYTTATKGVTVVNTPASATAAANAFVRADQVLTTTTATAGQPVAIVVSYDVTVPTSNAYDKNGLVIAPAGAITLAFNPVSGDPPIVQGIEILSDPNASTSSGFGSLGFSTFTTAAPQLTSVFGGTATDANGAQTLPVAPLETLTITSLTRTTPAFYNIYRSSGVATGDNQPPTSGAGTEAAQIYQQITLNATNTVGNQTTFTDPAVDLGSEYYYQVAAVFNEVLAPESASNPVVQLNTSDPGNSYDDIYPTWSPFRSVFSIAYSSNRSVTYTSPSSGAASETAISIGANGSLGNGGTVGAAYAGLLESQVVNLDPPTLVPYSGNEVLHINAGSGYTAATSTRTGITPGQQVTVTVRLSDREAGVDDGNVYLQIKDPDSKYQDAQNLEHKVFASDYAFQNQSNNPNLGNQDSGSSPQLINGGGYSGFNKFSINGINEFFPQRGSVGGIDGPESGVNTANSGAPVGPGANGSDTISVGRDGGGTNTQSVRDGNGAPVVDANKNPVQLPGGDPNKFIPTGPEYEAQVVNPQFSLAAPDTAPTDYTNPYYLAGVDDQQPFSGLSQFETRPATEWLPMSRLPAGQQDGQGGILYSVTWKTPTSPSDYYLDVIAYDKAVAPIAYQGLPGSNWRIYDNIWGFSSNPFNGTKDILLVSDYALGQKFAATTFGGQRGLLNLVPKLYGAESYVTDVDDSLLPNAIFRWAVYPGANANNPQREVLDIGVAYDPMGLPGGEGSGGGGAPFNFQPYPIANGLGVNSYFDRFIDDGGRSSDGAPAVRSQLYSIWRTLSRGPVPASVYAAYEPTLQSQPAVSDAGGATPVTVAAGTVPVATRCILWISPFTGDVLAGPGTIADPNTQNDLRAFVKAGGRLCVSGQDVGSALTQNGTVANSPGGFLSDVLNATLVSPNQGTHLPVGGTDIINNRISYIPSYDGELQGDYQEVEPGVFNLVTVAPSQRPIRVSNNYGGNIFSEALSPTAAFSGNWRTDGSLDQLGPYIQGFPEQSNNTNSVVGQIDTIKPNAGANIHTDMTLAPFTNPIPPVDNGNDNAASAAGGVGLIYSGNPITAAGSGTGSKVVYATFGLEGLSTEYYRQTGGFKPNPVAYFARNQRQNILHNIVSYLRTGSISGTIRATTGNNTVGAGIAGAIVYLQSAYGPAIPGRGTFSATTDSAGNYTIAGVEPGNYTLVSYKTGYSRAVSNPGTVLTVEGDVAVAGANLTLIQGSPGVITGTVTDVSAKTVAGASVTFTPSGGGTPQTTQTDANGNYTLSNVPPGTYTGTASFSGQTAASPSVNVVSGQTITVNFKLTAGAGNATGRVVDASGNPITGATVFFNGGGATTVKTATTDTTGTYTFPANSLPAGVYVVSATAPGFGNSTPVQATITSAATTTVQDIVLSVAANGTLGGLVTAAGSTTPLGGVTITITNTATGVAVSPAPVTTAAATAGPDGQPLNYGPVTLLQGTYSVSASQGGSVTSQTVTVPANGFVRADFTGATGLAPLHTFAAGLQFVSTPYDYSALGFNGLFGALNTAPTGATPNGNRSNVAVWNPLTGAYALDPNAPADALRLGVGYWVYLKNPTAVTQAGTVPTGSVQVSLNPAWNQIGVPSTAGVAVSSLTFAGADGVPHSFADAAGSTYHLVSPTLYSYNGTSYQPVSAGATLQPWQAYWIQVYTPVTMSIPTGR